MHLIIIRKKLIYNRAKQRLISRALALWAKVWERARGRVYGRLMSLTRLRARAGARDPYLHDVFKNNYRGRSGDSHGARRGPTQRVYMYVCIRERYSISYPLFSRFCPPTYTLLANVSPVLHRFRFLRFFRRRRRASFARWEGGWVQVSIYCFVLLWSGIFCRENSWEECVSKYF